MSFKVIKVFYKIIIIEVIDEQLDKVLVNHERLLLPKIYNSEPISVTKHLKDRLDKANVQYIKAK
jgi:hypothetical protein